MTPSDRLVFATGLILLFAAVLQPQVCSDACSCGCRDCESDSCCCCPSSLNWADLLNVNRNLTLPWLPRSSGGCLIPERCHFWCRNASDPIACYRDCMLGSCCCTNKKPQCKKPPAPCPQPQHYHHHHYHTHRPFLPSPPCDPCFPSFPFLPPLFF